MFERKKRSKKLIVDLLRWHRCVCVHRKVGTSENKLNVEIDVFCVCYIYSFSAIKKSIVDKPMSQLHTFFGKQSSIYIIRDDDTINDQRTRLHSNVRSKATHNGSITCRTVISLCSCNDSDVTPLSTIPHGIICRNQLMSELQLSANPWLVMPIRTLSPIAATFSSPIHTPVCGDVFACKPNSSASSLMMHCSSRCTKRRTPTGSFRMRILFKSIIG